MELAVAAAGAFAGAMGTDVWAYVRQQCAQLFQRHGTPDEQTILVRLDEFHQELADLPDEDRESAIRFYTGRVARALRPLAERSSEAEADLRQLVEELQNDPRTTGAGVVINSGQTFKNIKTGGGNFTVVGRDQIKGRKA
ncbi:hypothetical protein [Kitasatospora sp. NPDC059673]|uniref:hypothetical protein n=1 Tax=Kitasatospora sp. NPDC059673 TaxID=3346901 RepID=UPI003681069B